MGKYLFEAQFDKDGAAGLMREGGSSRKNTIRDLIQAHGGTLESFNFAFGASDVYVIAELPDNATAAAFALTVSASGAVSTKTVVLITPEEVDQASTMQIDYRPPGA